MTVLDFLFFFSLFLLSMQLVAGKVQKQDQQSKTLHLQTAVETVFSPCVARQKHDGGKFQSACYKMVKITAAQKSSMHYNVNEMCVNTDQTPAV